jgi:hypothetical protein
MDTIYSAELVKTRLTRESNARLIYECSVNRCTICSLVYAPLTHSSLRPTIQCHCLTSLLSLYEVGSTAQDIVDLLFSAGRLIKLYSGSKKSSRPQLLMVQETAVEGFPL